MNFAHRVAAPAIFTRSENFCWLDEIDKMVRDSALFGEGNFSGADIEMAVDLRGIANKDFAAQALGEIDSQRRFTRGGRPKNYDEPRELAHPEKAQWRSSSARSTSPASSRDPAICARLSFINFCVSGGLLVPGEYCR